MGDRANVLVRESDKDNGVYLYTHWHGTELPLSLKNALVKNWRWNDGAYLTRIIFDEMTVDCHDEEAGYGISAYTPDGEDHILVVNCDIQIVSFKEKKWTFEEYITLTSDELEKVWD